MTDAPDAVKIESRVLEVLQSGRRLTALDALYSCSTMRLPEYILRLKKRGLTIESRWETKDGKRFKSYALAK